MKLVLLLMIVFAVTQAKADCPACSELRSIVAKVKIETSKPTPVYPPLIASASSVVEKFSKAVSEEELASYVEALRALTAVDPGHAFIENTMTFIQKKRATLEVALSKLPARESKDLKSAIQFAIDAESNGPDTN